MRPGRLSTAIQTFLLLLLIPVKPAASGPLLGIVQDASSGEPIEGVAVFLRSSPDEKGAQARTDAAGEFSFAMVREGSYSVIVTRLGYGRAAVRVTVPDTASTTLTLSMMPALFRLNPVVVSPSRRMEKMLDSPAATSVVTRQVVEEHAGRSPSEYIESEPGVYAAQSSMGRQVIIMRGFGGAIPRDLHMLVDYRIASLATPRLADFWMTAQVDDDLDRIELVRGPGAALYGPNADRGVVHLLSRSPLDSPGSTLRVGGGERDVFMGMFHHAQRLGRSWAYRVSGQFFRGQEWPYEDPVESARRSAAIAGGADPDHLLLGLRNPTVSRATFDARADWRPSASTSITFAGGGTDQIHFIGLSDVGALQGEGWLTGYGQVRVTHGDLFAQSYTNLNGSGDTYFLRTGGPVVNKSRLYVGELQHGINAGARCRLIYGIDLHRTDPITDGTIHGRNEWDDKVDEVGEYVHSETRLSARVRTVAALRVDRNNRLAAAVASPRAAVLVRAGARNQMRFAYNRAFGTPDAGDFFWDFVVDSLPLPMAVRSVGIPEAGYKFHRENGVPFMRSQFTPPSAGGPFTFLPPDATLLWPAAAQIAQSMGYDLSGVPAPTSADISSHILRQDPATGALVPFEVRDIPRLKPTITNSIEVGYQGWLGSRVRVDVSAYRTWIEDLIGHFRLLTPNVFLDESTLATYLTNNGVGPAQAAALAAQLSRVPLGTITPEHAKDPADILLGSRNFGFVQMWGADGGITVQLTEPLSVSAALTWISRDLFRNLDGIEDVALNAPRLSSNFAVAYRSPGRRWNATGRVRAVDSYPYRSGVYSGEIGSYALLDFRFAWRPPSLPGLSLLLTADNILDDRHREFIGAPEVGRVALLQLRREF